MIGRYPAWSLCFYNAPTSVLAEGPFTPCDVAVKLYSGSHSLSVLRTWGLRWCGAYDISEGGIG